MIIQILSLLIGIPLLHVLIPHDEGEKKKHDQTTRGEGTSTTSKTALDPSNTPSQQQEAQLGQRCKNYRNLVRKICMYNKE